MPKNIKIRQPNRRHEQQNTPMPNTFAAGGIVQARIEGKTVRTVEVKLVLLPAAPPPPPPTPNPKFIVRIMPHPTRQDIRRWVAVIKDVFPSPSAAKFRLEVRPIPARADPNNNTPLPGNDNLHTREVTVVRPALVAAAPAPQSPPPSTISTLVIPTLQYPAGDYTIQGAERDYFLCFGDTDSLVSSVMLGGREAGYKESVQDGGLYFFWWAEYTDLAANPGIGAHELDVLNTTGYAVPGQVEIDDV